jgi:hypothetical protein
MGPARDATSRPGDEATRVAPGGEAEDRPTAWQVWYLALGLLRRRWVALGAAALLFGGGSQVVELLPLDDPVDNVVAIVASTYLYFLFLAFLEVVVDHDGRGEALPARRVLRLAAGAAGIALPIALVGTTLLTAAAALTALLIVPGVWFITRTGLTVPVMVVEHRGASGGVRRSLALTAGRLWLALLTVGLALVVDEAVDAEVAVLTDSPLQNGDWTLWVLGGLVSTVAVCITAPVVSMTFQRLSRLGPVRSAR